MGDECNSVAPLPKGEYVSGPFFKLFHAATLLLATTHLLLHANLQVDTEGTESSILFEGGSNLLRTHRVRTIVWEYGDKVNPEIFKAAKSRKVSEPSVQVRKSFWFPVPCDLCGPCTGTGAVT